MALPMDEQRILDEMERMLAADDPRLAARLAAFGQPGFGQALRTRRARATLSVMVLVLIAAVAAVFYLMSVLRGPVPPTGQSPHRGTHAASSTVSAPPLASARPQAGQRPSGAGTAHCAATYPLPSCGGRAPATSNLSGARGG